MLIRRKIIRDTVMLTAIQLILDSSALLLNVFITRRLGTSAVGILSLTGTFLGLAGIISNGNAFLCTSRLISEELGKPHSDPRRVLGYGLKLCLMLSTITSMVILVFSRRICVRLFGNTAMLTELRLMPAALFTGAAAGCLKGWFNAHRRSVTAAVCDIIEFTVKAAVIIGITLTSDSISESGVCGILITGIIAGNTVSLICLSAVYFVTGSGSRGRCSLSFGRYVSFAVPIMAGSILTSVLGSANDALIPVCLRQYGSSLEESLSLFGIFEAIVIPTIFFPSVVLCSVSGIVVSEAARAVGAGNRERIRSFTYKLIRLTLIYSVFISAALIRFGGVLGDMLGGGRLAGDMITFIAPVVPFIYMEIILESLIKGMGMQAFSSMNYLAEYVIRISVVLIFVSHIGFYGIALSYYASNVIGNCSRLIKATRTAGIRFRPIKMVGVPIMYAFMTMCASELIMRLTGLPEGSAAFVTGFLLLWCTGYALIFTFFEKLSVTDKKISTAFVKNSQ